MTDTSTNSATSIDSLTQMIQQQFGSNDIVGAQIMDVINNNNLASFINSEDFSIVKALVSFKIDGQLQSKVQSFLVKKYAQGS